MSANNETVAEVLRVMRDAAHLDPSAIEDNNHLVTDWFYDDECQGWLSSFADRIEAAWKRERDELLARLARVEETDRNHLIALTIAEGRQKERLKGSAVNLNLQPQPNSAVNLNLQPDSNPQPKPEFTDCPDRDARVADNQGEST